MARFSGRWILPLCTAVVVVASVATWFTVSRVADRITTSARVLVLESQRIREEMDNMIKTTWTDQNGDTHEVTSTKTDSETFAQLAARHKSEVATAKQVLEGQ